MVFSGEDVHLSGMLGVFRFPPSAEDQFSQRGFSRRFLPLSRTLQQPYANVYYGQGCCCCCCRYTKGKWLATAIDETADGIMNYEW